MDLRRRYEDTQEEFAKRLGVSVRAVAGWESGNHEPSNMALRLLDEAARKAPRPKKGGKSENRTSSIAWGKRYTGIHWKFWPTKEGERRQLYIAYQAEGKLRWERVPSNKITGEL